MSIFKKSTLLNSWPAYDVVERHKRVGRDYYNLVAGDKVILPDHLTRFEVGSAVSSALAYNEDPIASYNESEKNGHDLYWFVPLCTTLSSSKTVKETYIEVKYGDMVRLEGFIFEIEIRANKNLGLVKVI